MKRILFETLLAEHNAHLVTLLLGQRQVGKTTLLRSLQKELSAYTTTYFFDCEDEAVRNLFLPNISHLAQTLGIEEKTQVIFIDEAQLIPQVGSVLKLIHDHFPTTKVYASGSSSFLLQKYAGDSLFGRHKEHILYALHVRECAPSHYLQEKYHFTESTGPERIGFQTHLEHVLLYGSLPKVYTTPHPKEKIALLQSYIHSTLFKDIFTIEGIRAPNVFQKLLKLLAYQIGQEISYQELAKQLHIHAATVEEYISICEKFQLLFVLGSYSTNPRKEISKGKKIYFHDLGLRNALIDNFQPLVERIDAGAIFENYCIAEQIHSIHYFQKDFTPHFWRTYHQSEVDLVLTSSTSSKLIAAEIKYTKKQLPSRAFYTAYAQRIEQALSITKENFWELL